MKYAYFIFKNLTRKKVRTILTILSIMIAFLLFGLLRSLSSAFNMGAEMAGEDRLVSINKVTLIQPLPFNYVNKVKALEGVDKATMANWFGGYYQDQKNQFPQFPIDADEYFDIFHENLALPPEQMAAWKADRIGAVIGRDLANKFKWKVGDRIPLVGMFPQKSGSTTWEFVIQGIYDAKNKSVDTSSMFFHYDYFDKARQFGEGSIGWLIVKVKDPKQSAQVATAIDALFENSAAETKTSSEKDFAKSFAKQFGDIITTLILSAVFFTMLLVSGNTMAQSFRERIPEFAILKTLGFSDVALASSLPGLAMSWSVVSLGLVLIVLLGLVTGVVPAVPGLRLNIITALRRN